MATRISPLVLRKLSLLWSVRLAFHGASVEKLKASSIEEPWTVKLTGGPDGDVGGNGDGDGDNEDTGLSRGGRTRWVMFSR